MILSLNEAEFFLDPVTRLVDSELERLTRLVWALFEDDDDDDEITRQENQM